MKRKTTVLLAGTLTVSMLLGVAATANADSIGAFAAQAVHTVQTLAAPRSTAPTGTWFTVDGEPLDGFDPAKGADDPGTDYTDAETYTVDGKVEIHDVPAGWTVDCGMMVHDLTGKMSAYYLLKNGGAEYRWWFDGATDIVHTTDELRGLRLTVNGVEQPDDCSKDVTIHGLRGSDVTGFTGWPGQAWTFSVGDYQNGEGRRYVFKPKNADTPQVTYTFMFDAPKPSNELGVVVARLDDGSLVTGFDGTKGVSYDIPEGHRVTLENVPDGWEETANATVTGGAQRITLSSTLDEVTYSFTPVPESSYAWTYDINMLKDLKITTRDGRQIEGFDWHGGQFTIPYDYGMLVYTGYPDDWTVSSTSEETGTRLTIKVTFLMNGGTGEDITEYVQDGKKVAKPADPTKPGARFIGWMLDGNPYDFAQPVTKDLTLTAGWVTTHTVTYDYGHDGLTDTVTIDDGDVLEKPADPEWEGHTFTGWKMESGSMFDSFGQPIRNDMTLIAQWTTASGEQFTVTFLDPEGGTSTPAQQVTDGDRLKEPTKPVRDGYEFTGWLREDGKPYDFTQPVHAGFTLTAGWQPIQYNVVFSVNGGDHTIPTQKVGWQGKATEPAQPTREGYTFTGWYTDEACQNRYDFGTTVTHNLTLFAGWEKITPTPVTHTVTFDSDGGTTYPAQTVDDGEQAMFPGTPVKDGYTFVQWFLGGQPYDFSQPVTGDITLTAHWKKDETPAPVTHTVTFDTMGGSAVDAQTVDDGGKAVKPADPTRDGYEFTGWLLDGQPYDFNQPVTGDITLTAGWNATPAMHTVTIDPANGEAVTSYKVQDGARITQLATPVRDGYTFQGWTLGGQPYDFTQPVTGDITIVAQWEKDETPAPVTHTVTFDSNGGSAVDAQTVDDGGKAVKPADPTRDGYTFAGWMLDGQPYDFGQPVTGDITLTAEWTRNAVIDELKGVRALIDGKELDGFDPTRDGEYTIPAGSIVQLVDVPDGWEIVSRPGATTVTFTITNGDRNVSYTFTYGAASEDPNTPDDPDQPDDPSQPDNPGQPDDPDTPDSPGTDDKPNTGGEIHITGGGQQSNPNTVTDDVHVMTEDAGNLGATGAGILPAVAATAGAAILAAALAIILHVRRMMAADADPTPDHEA